MRGKLFALLFLLGCAQNEEFTDGSYIVVMNSNTEAAAIEAQHELPKADKVFTNIKAQVYTLTKEQALALSKDPQVILEKDQVITINAVQAKAPWGLDRIDQASLPLDGNYKFPDVKNVVNVYVIDTGIAGHSDFQNRAYRGFNALNRSQDSIDCNGHGTHVAGTIGGATHGVAKNVRLIGVKVLDCEGSGLLSNVIAGVEWVTARHSKPAVANMSLGGGVSRALDQAVLNSINKGVTYVVAAGNFSDLACNGSPARLSRAITVGATNSRDQKSFFSNYGSCVDLFAPGEGILSTWLNNSTATLDGTSMASPHVAGVAALYLARNPTASPDQVAQHLVTTATKGKVVNAGSGSPNRLLRLL